MCSDIARVGRTISPGPAIPGIAAGFAVAGMFGEARAAAISFAIPFCIAAWLALLSFAVIRIAKRLTRSV
jgi:lipopolysaccharide export LptBFGC system permease protein LptF